MDKLNKIQIIKPEDVPKIKDRFDDAKEAYIEKNTEDIKFEEVLEKKNEKDKEGLEKVEKAKEEVKENKDLNGDVLRMILLHVRAL